MSGLPVPPGGVYDLVVDGECVAQGTASGHGLLELDPLTRTTKLRRGPASTVVFPMLPAGEKEVEIWLPFAEVARLLALRSDLPITSTRRSGPRRRWVHHGSSISHGAGAQAPTGTWPVVAARRAGWDLVNLGFSGNAVLDPFTARAIRDQPADLITLKLGINVVNLDCFRLRAFVPAVHGFLDTIREGHQSTPILVISPIVCPLVEDRPGPTSIDPASSPDAPMFRTVGRREELTEGKLSLTVVRQVLAELVEQRRAGDSHLRYLDGRDLFGMQDLESMPLPDLLHPSPSGHRAIGARFAAMLAALAPELVPA